jgi:septum formation protein
VPPDGSAEYINALSVTKGFPVPLIVLASTSPWRKAMLEAAGFRVECEPPGVDERAVSEPDPRRLAAVLAEAKARAVARRRPDAWVLGADQVVTDGAEVWGKPLDPADHLARLQAMRGRSHDLVTGFCLLGPDGVEEIGLETTRLWVRDDLTDDELRAYVATGEGSGCAGGYAAEGQGAWLFSRIEGDWFNVMGLPLLRVIDALRRHRWRYGAQA